MLKIVKYLIIIIAAVVLGILASDYDGYVMLVAEDKSIKMNLVIFGLSVLTLSFALVISYRILEFVLSIPSMIRRKIDNLWSLNRDENLANIVEAIVTEDNAFLKHIKFAKVPKVAPEEMQNSILFAKLRVFTRENELDNLEEALTTLDKDSIVYRFFLAYLLAARGSSYEAIAIVKDLLRDKKSDFRKSIVTLAAELAEFDADFAIEILTTYGKHLSKERNKALSMVIIKSLDTYSELKKIRNHLYSDEDTKVLFSEKLLNLEEPRIAKKILTTMFNSENVSSKALSLYINNFEVSLDSVYNKVCSQDNANYDSMLVLLETALEKGDIKVFNITKEFIEYKALMSFDENQKYRFDYILYKFTTQS